MSVSPALTAHQQYRLCNLPREMLSVGFPICTAGRFFLCLILIFPVALLLCLIHCLYGEQSLQQSVTYFKMLISPHHLPFMTSLISTIFTSRSWFWNLILISSVLSPNGPNPSSKGSAQNQLKDLISFHGLLREPRVISLPRIKLIFVKHWSK